MKWLCVCVLLLQSGCLLQSDSISQGYHLSSKDCSDGQKLTKMLLYNLFLEGRWLIWSSQDGQTCWLLVKLFFKLTKNFYKVSKLLNKLVLTVVNL